MNVDKKLSALFFMLGYKSQEHINAAMLRVHCANIWILATLARSIILGIVHLQARDKKQYTVCPGSRVGTKDNRLWI